MAGLLVGARVHASMRGAPSSWPDRGARVAGLGFVVVALRVGHGSPATRTATAPTRASEAVVHLVLQARVVVFPWAPHGRQAVDSPDLKAFTGAWEETMGGRCLHGSGVHTEERRPPCTYPIVFTFKPWEHLLAELCVPKDGDGLR